MKNVGLHGPGSESLGFKPLLNSDRYILMPGHFPICVWNLIEKNPAHRIEFRPKYWSNQMTDGWRACKLPYLRGHLEQIANREDTNPLPHAAPLFDAFYGSQEFFDLGRGNDSLTRGEAVLLHLIANQ